MKEDDYRALLALMQEEDKKLYDISKQFSDLTTETKRILDTIKDKSTERKKNYNVNDESEQKVDHHRAIPRNIRSTLDESLKDVKSLHYVFDDFSE